MMPPLWVIGMVLLIGFFAAAELGFAAHRRLGRGGAMEASDEAQVLQSALVLLALLLGFTFSMALNRHEDRRQQVIAEANAIGTAWLRAGLIGDPAGARLQAHLGDYARSRLAMVTSADDDAYAAARARGGVLRGAIWTDAAAATAPIRTTAQAAALIEAVNAVLDEATTREQSIAARVPERVMSLLVAYAVVSAALLGYVMGTYGVKHRAATGVLFVLLAMTIVLIVDLDRPWTGAITISQEAMRDLVADIGRAAAAPER